MRILTFLLILMLFTACERQEDNVDLTDDPSEAIGTEETLAEGESAQVPQNVQDMFQQEYPNAQKVIWKADDDEYEVEFIMNNMEHEVEYDMEGNWVEIEREVEESVLPQPVRDKLTSDYADWEFDEAELEERVGGTKYYEIELEKGLESIEIIMDEQGNTIKFDV